MTRIPSLTGNPVYSDFFSFSYFFSILLFNITLIEKLNFIIYFVYFLLGYPGLMT